MAGVLPDPLRGAGKLGLYLTLCLILIPVQYAVIQFARGRGVYTIPLFFHRITARIFGLRVQARGALAHDTGRQILFVGNHLSYLDITVLGGLLPASFIAKKEVANWPLFGTLARLQRTVFMDRARTAAAREKETLGRRIGEGHDLILFAEGTSSDGRSVLPFKSSLFALAAQEEADFLIQPFSIILQNIETQEQRDAYAWYADMTLTPHLWAFAKGRGAQVTVLFHPPIDTRNIICRKEAARLAHAASARGVTEKHRFNTPDEGPNAEPASFQVPSESQPALSETSDVKPVLRECN